MKIYTFILFVCLCASGLAAQSRFQDPATEKWGWRDREWNHIVPAIYEEVQPNFDTIMVVKKDGKMGAIDEKGNVRIPLMYEQIIPGLSPFDSWHGYALVTKNKAQRNTWGMVNTRGKVVVPEKFQYVRAISPGLLAGRIDGDSILEFYNAKGTVLYKIAGLEINQIDIDNTCFGVFGVDYKKRFYKLDGTLVYPADPESGMWTDGSLTILSKGLNRQGMINSKGETIIPYEFTRINHGLPGHFIVEKRDEKYAYGGMGVYDKNGNVVIPVAHHKIIQFGQVYRVHDYTVNKSSMISAKGEGILPAQYDFSNLSSVEENYGKNIPDRHSERYISAVFTENRYQFLIRDDGRIIRPEGSRRVIYYSDNHPLIIELAAANDKEEPLQMAIDFNGKTLLPADYIFLDFTPNPNVLLGSDKRIKKIGFISLSAPQKTEFRYDYRTRFQSGFYRMSTGNKYDLYNLQLKRIHSGTYNWFNEPDKDHFEQFRAAQKTKEKLVAVAFRESMAHGEWLAITESGKEFLCGKPEDKPAQPPHLIPINNAETVSEIVKAPETPPYPPDVRIETPPQTTKNSEYIFQLFDVQPEP
ncbi:MAG: WG repeat-containing protein, partial [Saprospiraceae bacterium]|nr:WG repeat-containing protein [Saprospiraceae bacterium]